MILRSLILLALSATSLLAANLNFKDDFSAPQLGERRAARGPWKIADGMAVCTQDDALFKASKDHGPILFYTMPYTDAAIRFAFKAEKTKTLVFTANGAEGHVFRFVAGEAGTNVVAFPPGGDHKAVSLDKGPKLTLGEWVDVSVVLQGSKATVKIGKDYTKTVEHAAIAAGKINFSIGFSYGTVAIKEVSAVKP